MNKLSIALVVPGGVDRSGEYRVIPALLALIRRIAAQADLRVFALRQEPRPGSWPLAGATIENIGTGATGARAVTAILRAHRRAPFDLVHSIWGGAVGLVAVSAARMLGVPCTVHMAGGELASLPEIGYGGQLRLLSRLRERVVLNGAACFSAASAPMIAQLRTHGVEARLIPLGVDLDSWPAAPPRAAAPGETARLVHVASLNRVKDQTTLLQAFRQLTAGGVDATLDIIGEDTLGGEMQMLAARLGLAERVRFHGFLVRTALRPLVAAAHLHVVSSRHEAGPLAMLEAAALGVPTVGTAVGHVAEWAPTAAVCVPVGDAPALARALRQWIGDDTARLALAAAARQRALAQDADHTAREFMSLYRELTAANASR